MALSSECCDLKRNIASSGLDCSIPTGGATSIKIACFKNLTVSERTCAETGVIIGKITPSVTCSAGEVTTFALNGSPVNGTVNLDGSTGEYTFAPTIGFTGNASFDYDVLCNGVADAGGPFTENILVTANAGDARVTAIELASGADTPTPFIEVETRNKSVEHIWSQEYDNDAGTLNRSETVNFEVEIKDREFYCSVNDLIGQAVFLLFTEKGTNRIYLVGRDGEFVVTSISGGTGTEDFTPTTFSITSTNASTTFIQVLYDTSPTDVTPDQAATEAAITALTLQ